MKSNVNNKLMNQQILLLLFFCFLSVFSVQGCSQEDDKAEIYNDWIYGVPSTLSFSSDGGIQNIVITLKNGIPLSKIQCVVSEDGVGWCEAMLEDNKLILKIQHSYKEALRSTSVLLNYDQNYIYEITVNQEAALSQEDVAIKVLSAVATSEWDEEVNHLSKSYDGDYSTYFNSKIGAVTLWPFYIDYTLDSGHTLKSIVYTPRTDLGNKWGSFNKFDVMISTENNPDKFEKVASYERGDGNHSVFTMKFENQISDVKKVRFAIHSAYQNRISCAEMDFFTESKDRFDYSTIFADELYTQLRGGITEMKIKQMPDDKLKILAISLWNKAYTTCYRVAKYRPYQDPAVMATVNKSLKYSMRDNPTGIFANAGEKLIVMVKSIDVGAKLYLLVQDLNGGYGNSKTYTLEKGLNRITVDNGGLIYVVNQTQDDIPLQFGSDFERNKADEKTVQVHFVMGQINGYFDTQKNKAEEWNLILNNAKYQDIDVLGKYAHITWRVSDFKKYNTDITQQLEKYDRLVYLEQEFMGAVKYTKMYNNRMHFCIDYKASSPNASDYRTVYTPGYAEVFCNPDRFGARLWGPAHEVGHCNQTRPGLKWAGLTEVTNNIMSMYIQQQFGEPSKLLVDGHTLNGTFDNFYTWARKYIISEERPHCLPDVKSITREIQLVPFWQLKLYMIDALGKEDFYHDLYEYYRITPNLEATQTTEGILQLDFVRQVCRISGLNMIDFFQKWGFLKAVDTTLNDYSQKVFRITQSQIDALIKEINRQNYEMPHIDVDRITEDNLNEYKTNKFLIKDEYEK